jgi:hypothetical protein
MWRDGYQFGLDGGSVANPGIIKQFGYNSNHVSLWGGFFSVTPSIDVYCPDHHRLSRRFSVNRLPASRQILLAGSSSSLPSVSSRPVVSLSRSSPQHGSIDSA